MCLVMQTIVLCRRMFVRRSLRLLCCGAPPQHAAAFVPQLQRDGHSADVVGVVTDFGVRQ